MKEDKFINLIKTTLTASADYIGDDTAYIQGKDLILTQDTLIENVHFRMETINPYDLGIKAIAVNLSDIAASGGIPAYILISLSLPEKTGENFVELFYKGVKDITEKYNVLVAGGDLTRASKITISVAVIGYGEGVVPAKRSNAKINDLVIAIGESGSSGAGLWILETSLHNPDLLKDIPEPIKNKFIKSHTNPVPQLEAGRTIVKTCNKPALMDTSDGLADALYKICLQSNVSMEVNYNDIPVDKELNIITEKAQTDPFKWIFYGGEDYGLVGTVSRECFEKLEALKVPVTIIGKVIPSGGNNPTVYVKVDNNTIKINSESINKEAFSHFMNQENSK